MIQYLGDPENSTKKLLEIINSFGKVSYIHESVAFLYTNNTQTEKEIRETILFTITSKMKKNTLE
jgi:hypothetical protein